MPTKNIPSDKQAWHALLVEDVFSYLQTRPDGLRDEEAVSIRKEVGLNKLPGRNVHTVWQIFLSQFKNPLIYILGIATLVSLLLQEYTDAIFIVVVLLLNASIGTYQEAKAEKSASALQQLLKIRTTVVRGGNARQVDAEELVPGDVVILESGNRVPADIRMTDSRMLLVDESLLTGESLAVEKKCMSIERDTPLSDRRNMLYAGSTITSGRARGVVVETATRTELGSIAEAVTEADSLKPPLVIRMEKFAKKVAWIVMATILLLWIIGIFRGLPFGELFFLAVALAVSAIPEGLPVAVTVALSIGTGRMAKRNVIVRKLTAVEGLGSCTFIASDKTGTLTVNMQTVKKVVLPDATQFDIEGEGYNASGSIVAYRPDERIPTDFIEVAYMCNEGHLEKNKQGEWIYSGDAMDVALLALAYKAGHEQVQKNAYKLLHQIPYEPEIKYASVTYLTDKNVKRVAVKGASEVVLAMCNRMLKSKGIVAIDRSAAEKIADMLTGDGFRVLAFAIKDVESTSEDTQETIREMLFLGFAGFIDPLRPEAKEAAEKCHQAGIEVAMVTGDHPLTAFAIARELGIAADEDSIITGKQLDEMNNGNALLDSATIKGKRVFARVSPIQKMQLVEALSAEGHFVAVTGDGVNDVPALKKANIGVAMGSGTDMAKETAELIIVDDNFSSIVSGIEEGRFAYDNIRKVVYLLISTGVAEILLFFLSFAMGLPLPLTAIQLLWLNLVTNGIQDIALAMEGGEPDAMRRKPRNPKEGIFNKLMISQSLTSGISMGAICFTLWYVLLHSGYDELHARTLCFMFMVLAENTHVFNCRSELNSAFRVPLNRNYFIMYGVLLAQGIHILAVSTPFMQVILESDRVSLQEWGALFALSLVLIPVMEVFKWIWRIQISAKQLPLCKAV